MPRTSRAADTRLFGKTKLRFAPFVVNFHEPVTAPGEALAVARGRTMKVHFANVTPVAWAPVR